MVMRRCTGVPRCSFSDKVTTFSLSLQFFQLKSRFFNVYFFTHGGLREIVILIDFIYMESGMLDDDGF